MSNGRKDAPTLVAWWKELVAALSAALALVGVFVKITPLELAGVRQVVGIGLLLAGAFLAVWLAWGRQHGEHRWPATTLLSFAVIATLAAGLVLILTGGAEASRPTAATTTSATPTTTPSGLTSLPTTPPPGTGSSEVVPTTTSTTRSSSLPPVTTTSGGGNNQGGTAPPISEQRVVTLTTTVGDNSVWMDYWRQQRDGSGDLNMDGNGVYTTLGAQLALLPGAAEPDWFTCRAVTAWTGRANFADLHVGQYLCARTKEGRFARIKVTALPNSPSSNGSFVFYGAVWQLAG